jgi:hypothetical protein
MTNTLLVAELEKRMRPGAFSSVGFLGVTESLESVINQDHQTLEKLGISYQQIADVLARLLQFVEAQRAKLSRENFLEYFHREHDGSEWYFSMHAQISASSNLPGTDIGYLVDSKFQVFIQQSRGLQECPWECEYDRWSSFDFVIFNRQSSEYLTAPGLIVHLIRVHQFFEGLGSPYRVDPAKIIRLLEIGLDANRESIGNAA